MYFQKFQEHQPTILSVILFNVAIKALFLNAVGKVEKLMRTRDQSQNLIDWSIC